MQGARGRSTGLGIALVSAVAFGGSGVAAKPLIEAGTDPLHMVWLRVTGAALLMLPLAWRHRDLLRRRPALLCGFGVLAVAGVQAFYFASISRIPVGVALLVEYLGPALVLGWIRFVQRRPVTRAAAVGVMLAVTGLACVVEIWAGLSFDALGLLLALGAACCQACYFILSDHGSDGAEPVDPLGVIAFGLLIGTLVLTVIARPWNLDFSLLAQDVPVGGAGIQLPAALLLAWVVLIATVLAYITGVISVRSLSPQVAGVVACLEAVIATVLAWVLLREHLSLPQLLGGGLVLLGAFIAQSQAPKAPSPDPVASSVPPVASSVPPVASSVPAVAPPVPPVNAADDRAAEGELSAGPAGP
ncbi:EamA family transporter [Streptomyces sp. NPDC000594]|uniref:EamA family transporter n=1 Tax=Streptomyces sp. NPDC000594 TaxID=3154261 RepID=UPI00332C859A